MADSSNPGQKSEVDGIFETPFGNSVTGNDPIGSGGLPKPYDYGNATDGFDVGGYSEKGGGIISGPGTANGKS